MSSLIYFQRSIAAAVMQPLSNREQMPRNSAASVATSLVKPNARLTSFERLEIYNRQYWFRVLGALADDFPGLQGVLGGSAFKQMSIKFLDQFPSQSYTLRDLGKRLPEWIANHANELGEDAALAQEMSRLEWAHIEAFDAADWTALTPQDGISPEATLTLQPHLRLLEVHYPVDEMRLEIRAAQLKRPASGIRRHRSWTERKFSHPIHIAVHRADYSVHYQRLQLEEFHMLAALQSGATLSAAIDGAFHNSAIPEDERPQQLQSWFHHAMQLGWFCSSPTTTEELRNA